MLQEFARISVPNNLHNKPELYRSAVWPGMNDFGRRVNLNNRIVISTQFGCVICSTGWADRESEFQMDGVLPLK